MNDNLINTEIVFQIPSINRIFSFECDINMTTLHELRQMVSLLSHLPIYDILIYSSEINIDRYENEYKSLNDIFKESNFIPKDNTFFCVINVNKTENILPSREWKIAALQLIDQLKIKTKEIQIMLYNQEDKFKNLIENYINKRERSFNTLLENIQNVDQFSLYSSKEKSNDIESKLFTNDQEQFKRLKRNYFLIEQLINSFYENIKNVIENKENDAKIDSINEEIDLSLVQPMANEYINHSLINNTLTPSKYINDLIIDVFGRSSSKKKHINKYIAYPIETKNELVILDCNTEQYEKKKVNFPIFTNYQYFISYCAHCNYNNTLYITGGKVKEGQESYSLIRITLPSFEVHFMNPMKNSRFKHSMIACNGYLYAIGGNNNCTCEQYDIENNSWKTMNRLCVKERKYPILFIYNESILYVFSGYSEGKKCLSTSEKINLKIPNASWVLLEIKLDYYGCGVIYFDNNHDDSILFFGGKMNNSLSNEVFKYSFRNGKIEKINQKMETKMFFKENTMLSLNNYDTTYIQLGENENNEIVPYTLQTDALIFEY